MDAQSERIVDILERYLTAVDEGRSIVLEQLCADCPDLLDEVRQQLDLMLRLEQLADGSQPADDTPAVPPAPDSVPETASVPPWERPLGSPADGTPYLGETTPPLDPGATGPHIPTGEEAQKPPPRLRKLADQPTVPGYEILGVLGRGGMGVVYKARQVGLNRVVALKMILSGAHAGEEERSRFLAEAEVVAAIHHPGIVQIHDFGTSDGHSYFSMEFCTGGSLTSRMNAGPLPGEEAASIVEKISRAMQAAHEVGIVHRDLKPANVLVAEDGSLKVTDFGLAKRVEAGSGLTQTGMVMGTPSYMAPEQAEGKKGVGPAADVYALGAILYEGLTGRPPFREATVLDTILQVVGSEPVPPRQRNPACPRDLETICLKCLQKEPGKRYPSALELAEELRRYQAGEPILARPTGIGERAVKWARRRPTTALLVLASLLLLVSGVAGLIFYAQAQDHRARLAEQTLQQEIRDRDKLNELRATSEQAFAAGKTAFDRQDWDGARVQLTKALSPIRDEPRLKDLQERCQALLVRTEEQLKARAARQQSSEALGRLETLRDDAVFHSVQITGLDQAANRRRTREIAQVGLGLFGLGEGSDTKAPVLPDHLGEKQKSEVRASCYTLLLLWADAETRALPGEDAAGQARRALALLDRATVLRPPSRAYHVRRAECLAILGDPGAERERQKADRAPIGSGEAGALDHFLLASDRYQRRDFAGALIHLDRALQADPTHFWAQFLTGVSCLRHQPSRAREAKVALTACLRSRGDFVWGYLLRGFAYGEIAAGFQSATGPGEEDRRSEVQRLLKAAEDDFDRAFRLPRNEDDTYALLNNRGALRLQQGRPADAIRDFAEAVRLCPKRYNAHVNLSRAHEENKQPERAVEALGAAIALEPGMAALYRGRARLHLKQRDLQAGLADLDRAVARGAREGPGLALVAEDHKERGLILARQGQHEEAVATYDAALRARPGYAVVHRLRAESLLQLDRHEEAVQSLDRYLEQVAQNLEYYRRRLREPVADAYRNRGLARARLKHPSAALEDYTRALEIEPDARTHAYRGWVYVVTEAPRLAIQDFEAAVRLAPDDADARVGKATALVLLGRTDEALADAEAAMKAGKPTGRLAYSAARVYARAARLTARGAKPNSIETWRRKEYEGRAVELIETALKLLPTEQERQRFWSRYIQQDRFLEAILDNPRFGRLVRDFEASGKK